MYDMQVLPRVWDAAAPSAVGGAPGPSDDVNQAAGSDVPAASGDEEAPVQDEFDLSDIMSEEVCRQHVEREAGKRLFWRRRAATTT